MVRLQSVQESNQNLKATISGQIALFVGATSGIAFQTLTEYVRYSELPKVYIVGRNEAALEKIVGGLKTVNEKGTYVPIVSQISLLRNVDGVCEEVKRKEGSLDLLVMAPGYLKVKRIDNEEGLEDTMSLRYYARMRFIHNLLPLLSSSPNPRVVSIQGAGKEGRLNESDLELKHNYSFMNGAVHTNTMNTLALQQLSLANPSISFLHVFPGLVLTGAFATTAATWYFPLRFLFLYVVLPLTRPFTVSLQETGERNLFHATSARYPPPPSSMKNNPHSGGGVALPKGVEVARGPDKKVGSGCYLVDWNGEIVTSNEKLLEEYRRKDTGRRVWEHTLEIFERVVAGRS